MPNITRAILEIQLERAKNSGNKVDELTAKNKLLRHDINEQRVIILALAATLLFAGFYMIFLHPCGC